MVSLPTQSQRFWAYLFSNVFSLIFSFFALYFLLTDRTLRRALNNHIIIVLLIIGLIFELTTIPWTLYSDYNHEPLIRSKIFYKLGNFLNYLSIALQIGLFAWATIERHILIFHDQWVSTSRKRFFIHYLPIGAIIIYYLIYYSIVYFAPICEQSFDAFLAGGPYIPCVLDHTVLAVWDLTVHQVLPILIIIFSSTALLVRSIWQRNRLHQRVNWRKYRKMIIQLLSFSTLYFIFDVPTVSMIFAYEYGLPTDIAMPALIYLAFFTSYIIFLFPFVCCLSLPELREKFLRWRPTRQVAQATIIPRRTADVTAIELSRRNI
jgi:hypothetical protein